MDSFVLQTSDSDIQNGEFLGRLGFAANEADTGDARAISAVVSAMAEAPFTSTSNPTSIVFATAFDGDATNKLRITSSGNFLPFVSGIYDIGSGTLPFRKVFTDELRVGDYNFPTSDGSNGHVLSTDGAGQLSFVSVASATDKFIDSLDFDTSTNVLTIGRSDGTDFTETINAGGGTIDGGGTADYNAKWVDSDTLTSGIIHESGNTLGINTLAQGTSITAWFKNIGNNGSWIMNETTASAYPAVFEARENGKRLGVMYSYGSTYGGGSFASVGASGVAFSNITGDVAVGPLDSGKDLTFGASSLQYARITNSEFAINHNQIDINVGRDFRVASNNDSHALFVDGVDDRVGIGTDDPLVKLHVHAKSRGGLAAGEGTILSQTDDSTSWAGLLIRNKDDQNVASFQYGNSATTHVPSLQDTLLIGSRRSGVPVKFYQGAESNGAFKHNNERIIFDADGNTTLTAAFGKNVLVSGVNLGVGTTTPEYNLDVNGTGRFVHADGDCGLIVEDTGGSGVRIGDCAYAASSAYTGMTHTSYTNSQEYMIISSGYSTLVSSAANANTYIRGGENNNDYQLVVGTGYLAVGSANQRMKINSQKVEFNVNNEDYDFVVNGFGVNNLLSVDAVENTVGVGTTSVTGKFNVYNESTNGGGKGYGAIFGGYNNGTAVLINSSVPQDTLYVNGFYSHCYPSNNSTISQMFHFRATPPEGAGTIGIQHGFYAGPSLKHADQNRGFTSFIPSGDSNQNYNIYAGGTAKNYVSGVLGIGTSTPAYDLDVDGMGRFQHGIVVPSDTILAKAHPNIELGGPDLYDGWLIAHVSDCYGVGNNANDGLLIEKRDGNGTQPDGGVIFANRGMSGNSVPSLSINGFGHVSIGKMVSPTFGNNNRLVVESGNFIFNGDGGNYDFQVNANNTVNPLIYADADSGTYGRLGIGRTPGNHVVDVSGSMRINPLPAATVTATLNRNPGYPTIKSEGNNPANNWLILDSAGNSNRLALNYFNNDDVVLCHGSTLSSSTGTKRGGVGIGQSAAPGAYALRVEGATSAFNAFQIPDANFRVFGSIDDSLIYADAGLNRVGINTNFADLEHKFHVAYEPSVDDGIAILRDGSPNDGVLIGEQAYRVNDDYQGITHPLYTGIYDYMLISAGAHTFVGAKAGNSTYIRAGGNSTDFQAVVQGAQFCIGSVVTSSAANHFYIDTTGAYVRNNLGVGGDLNVTGDSSLNGALVVGGHSVLSGGLSNYGNANFYGNIQTIAGSVGHIDDGIFLAYPGGGTDHSPSTNALQTGYLKITLPVSWNYSMVNFSLDVYEYEVERLKTFRIGGYLYAGASTNSPPYSLARWHNVSAHLDAGEGELQKFNVQFLHDGTKCAVYISKFDSNNNDLGAATTWSYCQSSVKDVFVGYGGLSLTDWQDDWDVGFTTTLGSYNTLASSSRQQTTCARAYHAHESNYVFNEFGEDVDFRVEGDSDTHLLFTDASTDTVNVGSTNDSYSKLYLVDTQIDKNAGSQSPTSRGISIFKNDYTTATDTLYAQGINVRSEKHVSNGITDSGYVMAGNFVALHDSDGTLNEVVGVRSNAGGYFSHGGVIEHLMSFKAVPVNLGGGTITNSYGLYLGTNPTSTNSYGVYQIGPTDDNYFAGTVGVGTTYTSNAKLTVSDGAQTRLAIDTGTNVGSSEFGIDFIDRHLATSQGIEGQIASFVRSQRQGGGGSFDLILGTVDGSDLAADADEKVRITSDGIVGVGSTTQGVDPTTVGADVGIHIAADSFPEVHFTNDDYGHGSQSGCNIQLNTSRFITTNRIPDSSIEFYTFDTSSVTKQRLRLGHTFAAFNGTKEDIDFYVWGNDATNPLIYAQSNVDRVGINEVAPAYTLDVNGDVRLRGVLNNDTNTSTVSIFDSTTNSNQTKRNTANDTAWEGIDNQKWRIATPNNSTSAYKALFDVSLLDYRVTTYHGATINLDRNSVADGGDFAVRGRGGVGAGTDGDNLIRTDSDNHRVGIFTSSPQYRLDVKGSFSADSVNVNDAFTLPTADGALNQVMVTDGNGNLTWAAQSGTGGTGNNVVRGTVSASNNQTSFSVGGGYTPGAIDVYLNGVKLINVVDFTATNGSSIELLSAAQSGDTLEYVAFDRSTTAGTLQDTGDTMTGNLTVNADLIVTGYKETHTDNGNTGTAQTIDISDSTLQTYTLNGNCTFTMPTAEAGRSFTMLLKTGAGSFVATFTNVKFPANSAPTITTDANRMDLITFACDGTNWYGNAIQEYHV